MLMRPFGRDEHPFVLKTPGWREVEKTCDAGLGLIAQRLAPLVNLIEAGPAARAGYPGGVLGLMAAGHFGSARLDDVREPIFQGLVGGGMPTTQAGALVRLVFDEAAAAGQAPLLLYGYLAFEVISQTLIGLKDEPADLGEKTATAPAEGRRRSRTARPASPSSTPAGP